MNDDALVELGRQALNIEIDGLRAQVPRLGAEFARACRICLACRGRIVVTGMGKSGHVGGKIAATLASTGTPAFFVHAGEASHGEDGRRSHWITANYLFRGVLLQPGRHLVRFAYEPASFATGAAISGAGLMCLVGLGLWRRRTS